MDGVDTVQPQHPQHVPKTLARIGGWLFRRRTSLPIPIVLVLLVVPAPVRTAASIAAAGVALVAAGELLRLFAVRHIGVISRTRSERLGPLVSTGPFAWVRNPLYIGNVLLWTGFGLSAGFPAFAAAIAALLAFEYHAIVRWEETLLEARLGPLYRSYAARVPRWIPSRWPEPGQKTPARFSWGETLFSERGTLLAIAAGYLLLWLKSNG
jgi:protein-S-isoprenylcysteine O-methyltransferase Ste14